VSSVRRGCWIAVCALVVLAARTVAYALEPSPLARQLQQQAGGPRLWVISVAAAVGGIGLAAALVWLAALGVAERRLLEHAPVVDVPARPRIGRLLFRWAALSLCSSAAFTLLESTLHWRAGLGWHGLSCLTGHVHRDALPILVALSQVAAAVVAAGEHVLAWVRRTLARPTTAQPLAAVPPVFAALQLLAVTAPRAELGARGPPVVSL
jgi:hypothetical protein